MHRPKRYFLGAALLVLGLLAYYFLSDKPASAASTDILIKAKRGEFVIRATATGELQAKHSEKIRGPQGMRTAQIYQTTISDLVAEGTLVKAGEYVARLDKTELDTKMKDALTEIEKTQTQLAQAKIDTAIELRGIRDELINLRFGMKEKELEVEQSRYEAPMVIQQKQIDLERAERDYQQLQAKYRLTREKSQAKISEIMATLRQNQQRVQTLSDLAEGFVITAPKDGMVIYARSWNGKITAGAQISTWDPVVAELPDLTDMVSKTFVNEVDISRVQVGQEVNIKVDAFPDRAYSGQVISVANIGEQLRNYDSKVFEVVVQVFENDSILRPAMTTSNEIITDILPDKVFIPLEALHRDSFTYVLKNDNGKVIKQEVITGVANEDEIVIAHGLEAGEEVYLNVPAASADLPLVPLDPAIKQEMAAMLAEEAREREQKAREKRQSIQKQNIPVSSSGGGGSIIIIN